MPLWVPIEEWKGQDAFIVGGGSSLADFLWDKLKGKNTIGCNDAFRLGAEVIRVCLFGDASWFHRTKWELQKFRGRVVSCAPSLIHLNLPWVYIMSRVRDGLQESGKGLLAWNYSTGAAAINLAVLLGASRIFLLGFDMGRNEGKSHWHSHRHKPTEDVSFARFQKGFKCLAASLASLRPDVQVLNVTDGTSKLLVFPAISFGQLDCILETPVSHQREVAA
jgi:hypothetical protein